MIEINLVIDDIAPRVLLNALDRGDINYGTSLAMNEAMNLAQQAVRRDAFMKVFTERNKALAKSLTYIRGADRATKSKLRTQMGNVKDGRTGRMAGEGFVERQIAGSRKRAKGAQIAIPVLGPGLRRLGGGSLPKGLKPRANKKLFRIGHVLVERKKNQKKLVTRFVLQKTARASRAGRFEYLSVGEKEIVDNIATIWRNKMRGIIARHSMTSRGMGLKPRGKKLP